MLEARRSRRLHRRVRRGQPSSQPGSRGMLLTTRRSHHYMSVYHFPRAGRKQKWEIFKGGGGTFELYIVHPPSHSGGPEAEGTWSFFSAESIWSWIRICCPAIHLTAFHERFSLYSGTALPSGSLEGESPLGRAGSREKHSHTLSAAPRSFGEIGIMNFVF